MASTTPELGTPLPRARLSRQKWREIGLAYVFLAPATLTLFIFGLFPLGYAFYMSLYRWRVIQGPFVGLDNYTTALGSGQTILFVIAGIVLLFVAWALWDRADSDESARRLTVRLVATVALIGGALALILFLPAMVRDGDKDLFESLLVTLWYSVGTVPIQIVLSLALATILYQGIRGKQLFRMLFFLPYITPAVASAAVFRVMFISREEGIVNRAVALFGVAPQKWLQEATGIFELLSGRDLPTLLEGPSLGLFVIILFNIWTFVGFNTVVYLAGLGQVPRELYDAGEVDGGDRWNLFRHITIPLLSPTTFFLSMLGVIGTFKAFNHVYIMQVAGARDTTRTAAIFIFDEFYKSNKFGYAAALAFILFGIILSLTLIQNRLLGRKVFYDG